MADGITFTLDEAEVTARPGETLWQTATRLGTGVRDSGTVRSAMLAITPFARTKIMSSGRYVFFIQNETGCSAP